MVFLKRRYALAKVVRKCFKSLFVFVYYFTLICFKYLVINLKSLADTQLEKSKTI